MSTPVQSPDVADPAEAARLERALRKRRLLIECALLKDREDALKRMLDDKKQALQTLITEDGQSRVDAPEASAHYESKRSFKVTSPAIMAQRFTAAVLAEFVSVTVAFVEAAKKAGIKIDDCITEEKPQSFTISRPQDADAKAVRERNIEINIKQTADVVARLTAAMLK